MKDMTDETVRHELVRAAQKSKKPANNYLIYFWVITIFLSFYQKKRDTRRFRYNAAQAIQRGVELRFCEFLK